MKKIFLSCIVLLLTSCAAFEKKVVPPPNPDFTYMNKDNATGLVVVVPPSEIRILREMAIENKARIDKVEVTANKANATANLALENQNIFNNLLQSLSNKVEDYRKACEAMWTKILKK